MGQGFKTMTTRIYLIRHGESEWNNCGKYTGRQDISLSPLGLQQAEQIALDEVGWLPLYYGKTNLLLRPAVSGLVVTPQGLFPKPDWTQVTVGK